MNKTLHYKVVFLGETSVGKSSIVTRFTRGEFYEFQEPTIGAAFQTKAVRLDNCTVKMEFWDTAGQERYRSLAPMYYRGAKVAFVVYDITNKDSLNNAKSWLKEVERRGEPDCLLVLLGNKIDVNESRQVEREEVAVFSETNNIMFSEVSAKTGININEIMIRVAKELALKMPSQDPKPDTFIIGNERYNTNKLYGCC